MTKPAKILAQATAKLDVLKALRVLQNELRLRCGKNATSAIGENTIYISPNRVELTDNYSSIVARGHCRVATILVRKQRKSK